MARGWIAALRWVLCGPPTVTPEDREALAALLDESARQGRT